jgi:hypothetical protein
MATRVSTAPRSGRLNDAPLLPRSDAPPSELEVVHPVRLTTLREVVRAAQTSAAHTRLPDLAKFSREIALEPDASAEQQAEFYMEDPVDHPWLGRRETWLDYMATDRPWWSRWLLIYTPLRFISVMLATSVLGWTLEYFGDVHGDPALQAQALIQPVSAFSLLMSLLLTVKRAASERAIWRALHLAPAVVGPAVAVALRAALMPQQDWADRRTTSACLTGRPARLPLRARVGAPMPRASAPSPHAR